MKIKVGHNPRSSYFHGGRQEEYGVSAKVGIVQFMGETLASCPYWLENLGPRSDTRKAPKRRNSIRDTVSTLPVFRTKRLGSQGPNNHVLSGKA